MNLHLVCSILQTPLPQIAFKISNLVGDVNSTCVTPQWTQSRQSRQREQIRYIEAVYLA
jgi:hypothetical protein